MVRGRDRTLLYDALSDACDGVELKTDFHPLDDSVFCASRSSRAFVVFVMKDVTWGPDLSSYVKGPDEFRLGSTMVVDVPNRLDGRIEEVRSLFEAWFASD